MSASIKSVQFVLAESAYKHVHRCALCNDEFTILAAINLDRLFETAQFLQETRETAERFNVLPTEINILYYVEFLRNKRRLNVIRKVINRIHNSQFPGGI